MFSQQRLLSWVTVALLTVTLPLLSSCSLLVKGKQPVTITASEKDAEIRADGVYLGQGQATVQLLQRRKSRHYGHQRKPHRLRRY
mgnify:FL=1